MALIISPLISSGSGKLGGVVLLRTTGGFAVRALVTPVNPNTPQQSFIRATLADLSNRWANVLTQAERDLWAVYALNTPLVGPLGTIRTVSGLNMYVRANVVRRQATGLARTDIAPTIFDLGEFDPIQGIGMGVPSNIGFTFDNTDAWANETGSAMLVFASRPQNASIEFFRGPYQLAGQVDGDDTVAPTSPAAITNPFLMAVGQKVFLRVRVTRLDGRLSNEQFVSAITAP